MTGSAQRIQQLLKQVEGLEHQLKQEKLVSARLRVSWNEDVGALKVKVQQLETELARWKK